MTKPFRVEEQVLEATRTLRTSASWPSNFYDLLRQRDVDPLHSVMINATPDEDCICIRLIDQRKRVVTFDLQYEGAPCNAAEGARASIVDWDAKETEGKEWWWKEHARMTAPKPNNPIFVGLKLLDT